MQYCTISIILNFVQAKRICKKNHSKEIFTVRVIPTIPINQLNMKFIILNKKLVEIEKIAKRSNFKFNISYQLVFYRP